MATKKVQDKQIKKESSKPEKKAEIKLADMMPEELAATAKDLKAKIASAYLERIAGKAKNIKAAYNLRKQLARTLTTLKQKSHA